MIRLAVNNLAYKFHFLLKIECYKKSKEFIAKNSTEIQNFLNDVNLSSVLTLDSDFSRNSKISLKAKYTSLDQASVYLFCDGLEVFNDYECKVNENFIDSLYILIDGMIKTSYEMTLHANNQYNISRQNSGVCIEKDFKYFINNVMAFNESESEEWTLYIKEGDKVTIFKRQSAGGFDFGFKGVSELDGEEKVVSSTSSDCIFPLTWHDLLVKFYKAMYLREE